MRFDFLAWGTISLLIAGMFAFVLGSEENVWRVFGVSMMLFIFALIVTEWEMTRRGKLK